MFVLPESTHYNKIIPKNSFDQYTNSRQKKMFSDYVGRLIWKNKLSFETTNLQGKEIPEIQIFIVELKEKSDISKVLQIIDKAIPYHIIFIITYRNEAYISTSPKHLHPHNEDKAVIDYTFTSAWFPINQNPYQVVLKGSLDHVFKDFCKQFSSNFYKETKSINDLVENQKEIDQIQKEIQNLKSAIAREKQFNRKVELNLQLNKLQFFYSELLNST